MTRHVPHCFESFVVGAGNRLAAAAARAVAESPGAAYNPLVIYSGSGLGKTHLLRAIGQLACELQPELSSVYASSDELVDELHAAIAAADMEPFKRRYHSVDLLLLDDVQFLAGRRETQSEVLRLLNTLQHSGRQVVLTSDRPPADIPDLDERLITRLAGGLTVDIGAPDYETRVAILRKRCSERGVHFAAGVVEVVARVPFENVRELQGALHRLIANQTLGGAAITPTSVPALLGVQAPRVTVGPPTPAHYVVPTSTDEFASFVSDLASAVAEQLEPWRDQVAHAVGRWQRCGMRTTRLEAVLASGTPSDVDALLAGFERSASRLQELAAAVEGMDIPTELADALRDPERVAEAELVIARLLRGVEPPPGPRADLTRAEFEVGPSNQLAASAADEIAAAAGERYNPFFVHGGRGTGKTHLAHALANDLMERSGGAALVACLGMRQFVDELIAALEDGSLERWRARYRSLDALVLDDVQHCAGTERAQEELFHLFNVLHAERKQIVLVADRAPHALDGVADRLRSRFAGGLVVEIQRADPLLRERLCARLLARGGSLPERALVELLAARAGEGVAGLRAMVERMQRAAAAAGMPISAALARAELSATPAMVAAVTPAVADPSFLDAERVVWEWPEMHDRVIPELR